MPKTIHRRRPQDGHANQLAKLVVDIAVGEFPNDEDKKTDRNRTEKVRQLLYNSLWHIML